LCVASLLALMSGPVDVHENEEGMVCAKRGALNKTKDKQSKIKE
jgi:hypothetical protein